MKDLVDDIISRFFKRQPTAEDYRRIRELVDLLPPEISTSAGAMTEIVLRAESLRQFEAIVRQASFDAQNRIAHDMPERVEKAAERALNHLRDKLPIDASDRLGRLLKMGVIWTIIVFLIAGAAGWMLSSWYIERPRNARHAATETEFNRCIDSAAGLLVNSTRRGSRVPPIDSATVRTDLMICAAEYADRRALNR